jgi:O-antigen ligase
LGSGLSAPITKAPDGFETTHPHNIVYHALLRGGVFAALALAAFLAATCLQSIRAWRITGAAVYPALIVTALLPLQLEFTVVVGTAPGWDWLVLWMPIGLCIGAAMLGSEGSASRQLPSGPALRSRRQRR